MIMITTAFCCTIPLFRRTAPNKSHSYNFLLFFFKILRDLKYRESKITIMVLIIITLIIKIIIISSAKHIFAQV